MSFCSTMAKQLCVTTVTLLLLACSVVIFTKYQNLLVFFCLMEVQVEVIFLNKIIGTLVTHSLWKQLGNISWGHHWFPHEMMSEKRVQKFHADSMTNQKHYPDLGSDVSSVWNFCDRFSDNILWGNRWWLCKMLSVFSG